MTQSTAGMSSPLLATSASITRRVGSCRLRCCTGHSSIAAELPKLGAAGETESVSKLLKPSTSFDQAHEKHERMFLFVWSPGARLVYATRPMRWHIPPFLVYVQPIPVPVNAGAVLHRALTALRTQEQSPTGASQVTLGANIPPRN